MDTWYTWIYGICGYMVYMDTWYLASYRCAADVVSGDMCPWGQLWIPPKGGYRGVVDKDYCQYLLHLARWLVGSGGSWQHTGAGATTPSAPGATTPSTPGARTPFTPPARSQQAVHELADAVLTALSQPAAAPAGALAGPPVAPSTPRSGSLAGVYLPHAGRWGGPM